MALTKKQRKQVWDKSGGKCWYCGCDLPEKGWHADHFEPVIREADFVAGKFIPNGKVLRPGNDKLANIVPACAPCNLFKTTFDVEFFRQEIHAQIERARKSSVNFRTAERFGLIEAKPQRVEFWFEQQGL